MQFIVIDRAEVLDRDVEQGIVLATGEEPPQAVVPSGVTFFDLTRIAEAEPEPASAMLIQANLPVHRN